MKKLTRSAEKQRRDEQNAVIEQRKIQSQHLCTKKSKKLLVARDVRHQGV